MKKLCSILIGVLTTLILMLAFGSRTVYADITISRPGGEAPIEDIDYSWNLSSNPKELRINSNNLVLSGSMSDVKIYVDCFEDNSQITLKDLTIDCTQTPTSQVSADEILYISSFDYDETVNIVGNCSFNCGDYTGIGMHNNHMLTIKGTENSSLSINSKKMSIFSWGDLNMTGSLRLNIETNPTECIQTVLSNSGNIKIDGNVYGTIKNTRDDSPLYTDKNLTINSSGDIELISNNWGGIYFCCEPSQKLTIGDNLGKLIVRGYGGYDPDFYGAVNGMASDFVELSDNVLVYGSTSINSPESAISEDVVIKKPVESQYYSYYVGDDIAKSVMFINKNNTKPSPKPTPSGNTGKGNSEGAYNNYYLLNLLKGLTKGNKEQTAAKEIIDRDTYKSSVPSKTVMALDANGKMDMDMKVHPSSEQSVTNQKFLVDYYSTQIGKTSKIILTSDIFMRNDLLSARYGQKDKLAWNNLDYKIPGSIYAVVYNETDGAYLINGTIDANGNASFEGFILRPASTITIFTAN